MIKESIKTGNTVDEAKAAAMLELGLSDFDDFSVEVLQTPTKKILGLFGGSPAKVRVYVQLPDEKKADEKKIKKSSNANNKKNKPSEKKAAKKEDKKPAEPSNEKPADKKEETQLPLEKTNKYGETAEYIKQIVLGLGMEKCEITEMSNDEEIYFELECGDDYGIIIGKRGETLDAIQYLARMIANKGNQSYKRVAINVGNYRAKREETLKALARKTAIKAVRQSRNISLEPMNPYERRIIHTAVQEVEGASSHSVGSDLDRRVVITPVDGAKNTGSSQGRRNGYNRGRREKKEAYKPEISPDRAPKSDMDVSFTYGKVEIPSAKSKE